jgi:hypothetical protein
MADATTPELLGLPGNAELMLRIAHGKHMTTQLLSLQDSSHGDEEPDKVEAGLWAKLSSSAVLVSAGAGGAGAGSRSRAVMAGAGGGGARAFGAGYSGRHDRYRGSAFAGLHSELGSDDLDWEFASRALLAASDDSWDESVNPLVVPAAAAALSDAGAGAGGRARSGVRSSMSSDARARAHARHERTRLQRMRLLAARNARDRVRLPPPSLPRHSSALMVPGDPGSCIVGVH